MEIKGSLFVIVGRPLIINISTTNTIYHHHHCHEYERLTITIIRLLMMEIRVSLVVILGSAQGIGQALAEHLLTEGAKVINMVTVAKLHPNKFLPWYFR